MKRLAVLIAALGLVASQTGCRTGTGYPGPERNLRDKLTAAETAETKAHEDLEKLRAEKTVEVPVAGASELTAPKEPSIILDLAAVRYLLDEADGKVKSKDTAAAGAYLDRAADMLEQTIAALPRMEMAEHCERALALLNIGDVLGASREMERARRIDFDADPVTLGPDLEDQILAVRRQIETGKASEATEAIEGILQKLQGSKEHKSLERALACAKAAKDALGREAFVASTAEIAVARGTIASLKDELQQANRPGELTSTGATEAGETAKPQPTTPAPPAPANQPAEEETRDSG